MAWTCDCGQALDDSDSFCDVCGKRRKESSEAVEQYKAILNEFAAEGALDASAFAELGVSQATHENPVTAATVVPLPVAAVLAPNPLPYAPTLLAGNSPEVPTQSMPDRHVATTQPSDAVRRTVPSASSRVIRPIPGRDFVTIGRVRDCDICVEDPSVSTLHSVLTRRSDGWFLEDRSSTNGTWVRGQRLLPGSPAKVSNAEQVVIATTTMTLELGDTPSLQPSAPLPRGSHGMRLVGEGINFRVPAAETTIGRDPGRAQLVIADARVSSLHATVKVETWQLYLRDEASANGTLINGNRVPPRTWTLVPVGSTLAIGPMELGVERGG